MFNRNNSPRTNGSSSALHAQLPVTPPLGGWVAARPGGLEVGTLGLAVVGAAVVAAPRIPIVTHVPVGYAKNLPI